MSTVNDDLGAGRAVTLVHHVRTSAAARHDKDHGPKTREALLDPWDKTTDTINAVVWPTSPAAKFQAEDVAFGAYPGRIPDYL